MITQALFSFLAPYRDIIELIALDAIMLLLVVGLGFTLFITSGQSMRTTVDPIEHEEARRAKGSEGRRDV
jgi:hypothetical protein